MADWIADVNGDGDPGDTTADVVLSLAEKMGGGFFILSSGIWEIAGYCCRSYQVLHRFTEIQICRFRLELVGATEFGRLRFDLPRCIAPSYPLGYTVAYQTERCDCFDPTHCLRLDVG